MFIWKRVAYSLSLSLSLWYPTAVHFVAFLTDQVGLIMHHHVVHIILDEPNQFVGEAHFGEVEKHLVLCSTRPSSETAVVHQLLCLFSQGRLLYHGVSAVKHEVTSIDDTIYDGSGITCNNDIIYP